MRKRFILLAALAALVLSALPALAEPASAPELESSDEGPSLEEQASLDDGIAQQVQRLAAETEPDIHIVQFASPAAPSYAGGVAGLAATAADDGVFDAGSEEVRAYTEHLEREQSEGVAAISEEIGRQVTAERAYTLALNGVAVELEPQEAAAVLQMPEVAFVDRQQIHELETDAGPQHMNADAVWDGDYEGAPDGGSRGAGTVVGVLDSGIWPDNPSFAEVGPVDGYEHQWDGEYLGVCDPDDPDYDGDFACNDKLVGAWGHTPANTAFDSGNHGTHTSSTATGNVVDIQVGPEGNQQELSISGVAPHAHVVSYRVCDAGCPLDAIVAGVDQAVEDGVDVINYSIGGSAPSDDLWVAAENTAWLNANGAGIAIAHSAGNAGPGDETVNRSSDLPWVISVGASEHNRAIENRLVEVDGLDGPVVGKGFTGSLEAGTPVVYDTDDPYCYDPDAEVVADAIVLCDRGGPDPIGRVEGSENVAAAGGAGFVLMNTEEQADSVHGDEFAVPGVHVSFADGETLKDLGADGELTAGIAGYEFSEDNPFVDYQASFSSRGPNQAVQTLVPNVTAPGLDIIAAVNPDDEGASQWGVASGTSMSSPHVAGAYGLLAAEDVRPNWSPAQTQSALQLTARAGTPKEDGTSGDPHSEGSGYADLSTAVDAGFVMDITQGEYEAADPEQGGDVRQLNSPEFVNYDLYSEFTWHRTLESAIDVDIDWTLEYTIDDGATLDGPSEVTISADDVAELSVTIGIDEGIAPEQTLYGHVTLTNEVDGVPDARMPVAVTTAEARSDLASHPNEVHTTQGVDEVTEHQFSVVSSGNVPLEWEMVAEGDGLLWDQPVSSNSGVFTAYFESEGAGVYNADDFRITADDTTVDSLYTGGMWSRGELDEDATELNWYIYEDANGQPAGHPEDGQDNHIWSFSAAPDADGVIIEDQSPHLDIDVSEADDLVLDAGSYWLAFFPSITTDLTNRWAWREADLQQEPAQMVDPEGLVGGSSEWGPLLDSVGFGGLAFSVQGQIDCSLPSEVDWLDIDQTDGVLGAGEFDEITATFDSAGMEWDTYEANLCLESSQGDVPIVVVPLTMDVGPLDSELTVEPESLDLTVSEGGSTDQTVTLINEGDEGLEWDAGFADAYGEAVRTLEGDGTKISTPGAPDGTTTGNGVMTNPDVDDDPRRHKLDALDPAEGDVVLTHSNDQAILEENSVACTDITGFATGDNHYLRAFSLNDFDIDGHFAVEEVSFGIETLTTSHHVDVTLYQLDDGEDLLWENLDEVGSETAQLVPQGLTLVDVPVEGTIEADSTLVVDIFQPETQPLLHMFIGSNDAGETGPTYWAADGCGYSEPIPVADAGYPDMHLVMNVTGKVEDPGVCWDPDGTSWLSADPGSGTVDGRSESELTVHVDASELSQGEYEALLCVNSSGGDVQVPVSLSVEEDDPPEDPVDLVVVPGEATVGVGGVAQFEATAVYEDDTEVTVTGEADWVSADDDIATVDDAGLVVGVAEGTAEVAATFEGLSDGSTVTVDAEVEPGPEGLERISAEPGRVEVAIAASQHRFGDGEADAVVLARADEYPDALAGTTLAAEHDAPLLLTSSDQLLDNVADEIARVLGDDGQVFLAGGTAALDETVEEAAEGLGYELTRLGGQTRFETAGLIAEELGERGQVLVTTGLDFPDALTAGAAASANDGVVLLSAGEDAHDVVDEYLAGFDGEVTAVGGPATRAYPDAEAVMGATRDETAVAVAEAFFDEPAAFGVARRDDYPDALSGGAHIAAFEGPLLLTYTEDVPEETADWLSDTDATGGFVYGGTAAVSEDTFDQLEQLTFGDDDNDEGQ